MSQDPSRAQAKQRGLIHYFTGKPCVRGHVAERCTANGSCHQCVLDRRQKKRVAKLGYRSRAEITALNSASTRECSACHEMKPATSEFFLVLRKKQPNGTITTGFARECRPCRNARFYPYYDANRERLIASAVAADRANPERKYARDAERYAAMIRATPPWVDRQRVETIYALAGFLTRVTGIRYEVDHYYPLKHKLLCGLHVPWNLRVIPAAMNIAKGSRLPGEFESHLRRRYSVTPRSRQFHDQTVI